MNKDILFEKINNKKIDIKNNEQLLELICKILKEYKLVHSKILLDFFKNKNLLKVFEFNRRLYKYTPEGYLSKMSLTYALVFFDTFLGQLENLYKRKSISEKFLDSYFENEKKLTCFCSDIVGTVFNKNINSTYFNIERKTMLLLTDEFLTGLNKMKLYYNIYFGKASNKHIMNYKNEISHEELLEFIYKISKDLKDEEIMYIYSLCKKDMEELSKSEIKILDNIIKSFSKKKSNIIVEPNFLTDEDKNNIQQIPNYLNNIDSMLIFKDFNECNEVISKEILEVCTFIAQIRNAHYICKIRKITGSLHLYIYDNDNIIFRDRIYFLEDLKRFSLIIKEYNTIKENNYNFWNA